MSISVIVSLISIVGLITLHEVGHFALAKKFKVKVDEFGIGYPPRVIGKKIGETIYSINLLPFGGFVKMPGEVTKDDDPRSFSNQPVWKRALIVIGGVVTFWVMAAILFSIVFFMGARVAVPDNIGSGLIDPEINIVGVAPDSPAQLAGLKLGDSIKEMSFGQETISPTKVVEIQEFTAQHFDQDILLTVGRGEETFQTSLIPRPSPPQGEGPMGVALARTAIKKYPWYQAPWQGIVNTWNLTGGIIEGYARMIGNIFAGQPSGVQLAGPVRIVFDILPQAQKLGASYFLNFLGMLAVYLAIFNILPIPALDGGKLLFLGIESIRKKPVSEKTEQNITVAFFLLLVALMVWVTIKDISILL
jgi:regulator of sigma E protease